MGYSWTRLLETDLPVGLEKLIESLEEIRRDREPQIEIARLERDAATWELCVAQYKNPAELRSLIAIKKLEAQGQ